MVDEEVRNAIVAISKKMSDYERKIAKIEKDQKSPMFISKSLEQMEEELTARQLWKVEGDAGLAEDAGDVLRYSGRTNETGTRPSGIESFSQPGRNANLMEVFQDLTVASTLYNFTPLGPALSFYEGVKIGSTEGAKKGAVAVEQNRQTSALDEMQQLGNYMEGKKKFMEFTSGKPYKYRRNPVTEEIELVEDPLKKTKSKPSVYQINVYDKNGKMIGKQVIKASASPTSGYAPDVQEFLNSVLYNSRSGGGRGRSGSPCTQSYRKKGCRDSNIDYIKFGNGSDGEFTIRVKGPVKEAEFARKHSHAG